MTMELKSSESVTRYLRSKTITIPEVISVSNDLLEDKFEIYFPGKETFVFELLCDRLSDAKNKKFRAHHEIWHLFVDVWRSLDSQPQLRQRIFKKIRFMELLALTFGEIKENDFQLVSSVMNVAALIIKETTMNVDDSFFIGFFSHYLSLINKGNNSSEILVWTKIANNLFQISSLSNSITNKKSVSKFSSECGVVILDILQKSSENEELSAQTPILQNIFNRIIFSQESLVSLKHNTELIAKTANISSITFFFKLIIKTLVKSDIQLCEELFSIITKKFPESSESLLSIISQANRTLSPEFLKSIIDLQLDDSTNGQNWLLIAHLIDLDVDIALTYGEKIIQKMTQQKYSDSLMVGEKLANAYVRAREFTKFFSIWQTSIEKDNKIWGSDKFCEIVATKIHDLSPTQLAQLVAELTAELKDQISISIMLSSISYGLFSCSPLAVSLAIKAFEPVLTTSQDSDYIWKIRYNLLCCGDNNVSLDELVSLGIKSNSTSEYLYYTLFRLRELYSYDISPVSSKFISSVKKSHFNLLLPFNRWLVLINNLFTPDHISEIVALLFKEENVLKEVFSNDFFYEQKNLIKASISHITDNLKTKKDITQSLEIIIMIPTVCFTRHDRQELLESLYSLSIENITSQPALLHLLAFPTFKSTVEKDTKNILKLIDASGETSEMACRIFETVWDNHVQQANESISKKFIEKTFKSLEKPSKKSSKLDSKLRVSLILVTKTYSIDWINEHIDHLATLVVKRIIEILVKGKKNSTAEVSWLLKALYDVQAVTPSSNSESVKLLIKTLGNTDHDTQISIGLFNLLSQVSSDDIKSSIYIMSLYIVLRERNVPAESMMSSLMSYLKVLPQETFNKAYVYLISSTEQAGDSLDSLVELLVSFMKSLSKSNPQSQALFAKSLASLNQHKSIHIETTNLVLECIKATLTESTWCFVQYSIELVLDLIATCALSLKESIDSADNNSNVSSYILITHVLSNILLFHRFRLSNRHHLVISVFSVLMECLVVKQRNTPTTLSTSKQCGFAYSRLMSNLCEPPSIINSKDKDKLTSTSSLIKRSLRKHLGVLLLNYVHLSLKYAFQPELRDEMVAGIYTIFDVLSSSELVLVSASLDSSGKAYFKTLYDDYKKFGKWRDQ